MKIKKLSLAAVLSIGMFTASTVISLADVNSGSTAQKSTQSVTTQEMIPVQPQAQQGQSSAYGGGTAGTYRAQGTYAPGNTNAAGSTEISTFTSPSNQVTGGAAALAAQGIYGQCVPCHPTQQTGGASGLSNSDDESTVIIQPVATPETSEFTGGAAAAEAKGMKCIEVPVVTPNVTGGAVPIISPSCIPNASCGQGTSRASTDFNQPMNPGSIGQEDITGGACPVTQPCPSMTPCPSTAPCPAPSVIIPVAPMQQTMPCPPNPCVKQEPAPCPMPKQSMQCEPTGGAAEISSDMCTQCPNTAQKADYIERQVYAYPGIPGIQSAVPTGGQVITFGGNDAGLASIFRNQNLALNPLYSTNFYNNQGIIGYNQGIHGMTGAAAPLSTEGTAIISKQGCPVGTAAPLSSITGAPLLGTQFLSETGEPVNIRTSSSYQLTRTVLVPGWMTGAAAQLRSQQEEQISNMFNDISSDFWASNAINRLASNGIVAGYPDRSFKPNLPVSRAELASMLISGLNLQEVSSTNKQIFKDVPQNHWASQSIDKAYVKGIVSGYPNDMFKPNNLVTMAEAIAIMSKAVPCDMSMLEADRVLSQYKDGYQVPNWAKISVARALRSGILQNFPSHNMINPNQNATRAEIASMLSQVRVALALDKPTCPITGAAANLQPQLATQTLTIPTLNVKFDDRLTAKASHVGDKFKAKTLEKITINEIEFPAGSVVSGKIVEVIRPGGKNGDGALKLAFTDITGPANQKAQLPRDILTAQVQKAKTPNIVARTIQWPFVWTGNLVGIAGRTVGSAAVIASNASEQFLNGIGVGSGELVNGKFAAAGRSYGGSFMALGKAPFDITRTALSGAGGMIAVTSDEIGYLVSPGGSKVANVNPNEQVTIAFGCK